MISLYVYIVGIDRGLLYSAAPPPLPPFYGEQVLTHPATAWADVKDSISPGTLAAVGATQASHEAVT